METAHELHTHEVENDHWWYSGRRRVLNRVIDAPDLPPGAQILDAGCGSGRNMVELARRGEVTGIELSPASVAVARERHVGDVVQGSVADLPFDDDSFDFAVCLDVIEHLEDDLLTLRELRRVIRPGRAAARDRARLPLALEQPRRRQPPPSPLYAHLAAEGRLRGRMGADADHALQLAAAARGDGLSLVGAPQPPAGRRELVRPRPHTAVAELGPAPAAGGRGRGHLPRAAHPGRVCRCSSS